MRNDNRRWPLLLALFSAAVLWFLSQNHGFVPMWVEGAGEHVHGELATLGYDQQYPGCQLHIGTRSVPLGLNPHIGPAWFYLYLPTHYLWFHRLTTDPFVYRYTGIVIFIVSGWVLYFLVRKHYKQSISFYASLAFLTNPLFLLGSLTDYEFINVMVLLILLTALFFSSYIRGGGVVLLLSAAVTLGMLLQTRIELVVWLTLPFTVYLLLVRPPLILDRWRQTKRKFAVTLSAAALFCVAASPVIAYNLHCPEYNIFSFTANNVLPRSGSTSLWRSLAVRAEEFWSFNLLNLWPMYELRVGNYVMAALWIVCAGIIVIRWVRKGQPSVVLVMVAAVIVLSTFTSSSLKNEHLNVLEPAALLTIVSALAYLEERESLTKLAHAAFAILIAGNIAVSAMNWRLWKELPPNEQTMINQSDAVLLARYLSDHHAGDRILYTNVGMIQYVLYMTAGTLRGEEIMDWTSVNGFVDAVKLSLLDKSRRRVFVAVSSGHDGLAGSTPRTKVLYAILDRYNIPHLVTNLSNERNRSLYDLIVVEEGITLPTDPTTTETILLSEVVDVRAVVDDTGNRVVIGSILGAAFKRGDAVRINDMVVPSVYGNDTWITFSVPLKALSEQTVFTVEVVRAETLERSRTVTVRFQR